MNKRKQKLIIGFCAPTAAVGLATGVAGLAVSLTDKQPVTPPLYNQNKISFVSTQGAKLQGNTKIEVDAGTTFDKVDKPVVCCDKGYKFGGWVDENGNEMHGNEPIRANYKLTPITLNASETSEYATIKFEPGTEVEGVKLQGNTTISVMKKHRFYMVNRPSASVKDASGRSYAFKGWYYKTGTSAGKAVGENDVISEDVTLIPKFNAAVTITWNPGTGTIKRGKTTTTAEKGSEFSAFNQPQIENGDKYFEAWYKGSIAEENKLTESTIINEDMTVIANWADSPTPTSKYVKLHFNAPDISETTFTITPSENTLVAKDETTFANVNKPTIADANNNYRLVTKGAQYEYSTDGETWHDVDDTMTFTEATTEIRPKMEYAVDSVAIEGEATLKPESTTTFTATVYGGSKTETVTWKIYSDYKCEHQITDSTIASINSSTGELTIGAPSDITTIYVQATSAIGSKKSDPAPVTIIMPYNESSDVWFYDSANKKWMYFTQEALCNQAATTVTPNYINGTAGTAIDKITNFNYKIIFGDKIKIVNKDFMTGFSGFNGEIDLQNVAYIDESFLSGCTSFNQSLKLDNICYIAPNFLGGCTSYNQAIDFSANKTLYEIGDDFMKDCTSFNSTLTLPTGFSFVLGNNFLQNCSSFTKDFTLPNCVTYFGDFFMNGCDSYTGTITVECEISDATCPGSTYCFISEDPSSAIATTGFSVTGTYATEFTAKFPTQSNDYAYRKLLTTQGHLNEEEWTIALAQAQAATKIKVNAMLSSDSYNKTTGEIEKSSSNHYIAKADTLEVSNNTTTIESCEKYDGKTTETLLSTVYYRLDKTSNAWFEYKKLDNEDDGKIYGTVDKNKTLTGMWSEMFDSIRQVPYDLWTFDGSTSQFVYSATSGDTFYLKFNPTTKLIQRLIHESVEEDEDVKTITSENYDIDTKDSGITMPTGWTWQLPHKAIYDSESKTSSYTFSSGMSADQIEWIVIDPKDYSTTSNKYKQVSLSNASGTVKHVIGAFYGPEGDEEYVGGYPMLWHKNDECEIWVSAETIGGSPEEGFDMLKIQPFEEIENFSMDADMLIIPIAPFTTTTDATTVTFAENTLANVEGNQYICTDEGYSTEYNPTVSVKIDGKEVASSEGQYYNVKPSLSNDLVVTFTITCYAEKEADPQRPAFVTDGESYSNVLLGEDTFVHLGDTETMSKLGITLTKGAAKYDSENKIYTMDCTLTIAKSTLATYESQILITAYYGAKTNS